MIGGRRGERLALACGSAGPVAFVGAWLVGGLQTPGYDPVRSTISQLAREQAATAPLMTGGFVAFGVLMPGYATALRRALGTAPALATATSGIATLAVAALPLSLAGGQAVDQWHHVAAGIGYVGQALAPLLAARALRSRARAASYATSETAAAALVASVLLPERPGL